MKTLCSRCKRETYLAKQKCKHEETKINRWETSKAFITDMICANCGTAIERNVELKS